jgi:hypothetical protein
VNRFSLDVALDDEHALTLSSFAERAHTTPGALASSLLTSALDRVDADARHVTELLDGIAGAFERGQLGLDQARAGLGTSLEEL